VPLSTFGDRGTAERLARLFAEVFSFFAAGLFADMWLVYAGLAKSADRVFRNCAALKRKADLDAGVVYAELAEYDCALAAARPIPGWLEWLLGKGLASAWTKCSGSDAAIAGRTGS